MTFIHSVKNTLQNMQIKYWLHAHFCFLFKHCCPFYTQFGVMVIVYRARHFMIAISVQTYRGNPTRVATVCAQETSYILKDVAIRASYLQSKFLRVFFGGINFLFFIWISFFFSLTVLTLPLFLTPSFSLSLTYLLLQVY